MLIYLKPNRANGREDEGAFDVCQIGSLYMYRGGRGIGNASCRLEVIRHLIQQPIAFEAIISSVAQSPRNFRSASPPIFFRLPGSLFHILHQRNSHVIYSQHHSSVLHLYIEVVCMSNLYRPIPDNERGEMGV